MDVGLEFTNAHHPNLSATIRLPRGIRNIPIAGAMKYIGGDPTIQ